MRYADLWPRLLADLADWAEEVSSGDGITVTYADAAGSRRTVSIEMTPDEWDETVSIRWGDFESAAAHVRRTLLSLAPGEDRLVYDLYDLVLEEDRYDNQPGPTPGPDGVIRGYWTARPGDPSARFPNPPPD